VAILVPARVGVPAEVAAVDYALRFDRLPARYASRGEPDQGPVLRSYLAQRGTTAEVLIRELLAEVDVVAHLGPAGLTGNGLAALRRRLIGD
jgi:protein-tyrosine phosphatase